LGEDWEVSGLMSIAFTPGLRVRIAQYENAARPVAPLPLLNGFDEYAIYIVLGIHIPDSTSECYLLLANDRDELWWISNRHLRVERGEE
jgi:hypothetical protein